MRFDDKLLPYYNELKAILPELTWYGSKNTMEGIDEQVAVLTYSTSSGKADTRPHFWTVNLNLYITNNLDKTGELALLKYDQINETELDEKLNDYTAFTKRVVVM